MTTYNGYKSRAHWNTALWINNDERFHNVLINAVERAVYGDISKAQVVVDILHELPRRTPDGERWMFETIKELVEENYNYQLQYS